MNTRSRVVPSLLIALLSSISAVAQVYPYALAKLDNVGDSTIARVLKTAECSDTATCSRVVAQLISRSKSQDLTSRQKAAVLTTIGYHFINAGDQDAAFPYFRKAIPFVDSLGSDDPILSLVHGNFGMYMAYHRVYDEALPHLIKSLPGLVAQNTDNTFKEDDLYYTIIQSFYAIGERDSAAVYQDKMVTAAASKTNPIEIATAYNNVGLALTEVYEFEEAVEFFNRGLEVLDTTRNDQIQAYVNVLESRVHPYIRLGRVDEGLNDILYVYYVRKRYDSYNLAMQAFAYTVDYHLANGRVGRAWQFANNELDYLQSQNLLTKRSITAYRSMAQVHEAMGQVTDAEEYSNIYNRFIISRLRQSGALEQNTRSNLRDYMTYRNQAYEQTLELERLAKEKYREDLRRNRLLLGLLAVVFALVAGLSFVIVRWRNGRKQRILALEQKTNEALQLKNENLQYRIELQEKDLKRIATDNRIRTELKRKFIRQLRTLQNERPVIIQKRLSTLIENMEQTVENQEQLSFLQDNIQDINSSFEDDLKKKFEGISAQEIKLCSLIKLGMNNHDIAQILNKKDSTIRSYKFRLKQKAGLESVRELETVVMDM